MAHGTDFTLKSRRVVLPPPAGERPASIHIRDGRIESIGSYHAEGEDLGELVILPGLIDPHVHVNEPGRSEWEGFDSATRAAAAGGITLIADMPLNCIPVTTTVTALNAKRAAAAGQLTIDVAFHGGLVRGNAAEIPGLVKAGVVGIKAFLCHSGLEEFPHARASDLRAAMMHLANVGVPLLVHAEIAHHMPPMIDPQCYEDFVATRPRSFEREAVELLVELCRQTGAAVHVVHLADAGCLAILRAARRAGLRMTVETCPHHLFFDPRQIRRGATEYKCAPPIRGDRRQLLQGLRDGEIDLIASDHSPCPPAMKQTNGRLDQAWGGISSLQLGVSIVRSIEGANVTPADVARWMSRAPAHCLGVAEDRGDIAPGKRADMAVIDWDRAWTVNPAALQHRHPITPYAGRQLVGCVRRTYLAGQCIYDDGCFPFAPVGTMITRHG